MEQQTDLIDKISAFQDRSEAERKQLRFAFNTKKLARGEVQVLRSSEFVLCLQEVLQIEIDLYLDEHLEIVKHLGQALVAEDPVIRGRSLAILSPVAGACSFATRRDATLTLLPALCAWLEFEKDFMPGYEVMVSHTEQLARWLLERSLWQESVGLLMSLSSISTSELQKSKAIRSLAGKVLSNLCQKALFDRLTNDYLQKEEFKVVIRDILLTFGEKAALYQLGRVIVSQSKEERLALIKLIPEFGDQVVPVLSDCLERKPPWYVVRNVIYIIGEIGIDQYYPLIESYLNHRDERVQYEIICTVVKLGTSETVSRLIFALRTVNDRLKAHVIRLLGQYSSKHEGFFTAICELAEKQQNFSKRKDQDLVRALVAAFKTFPCLHTTEVLNKIQRRCLSADETGQLTLLIEEAILFIEPMIRHSLQERERRQPGVSFDSDPAMEQHAFLKMQEVETKLRRLIGSEDMAQVGQFIEKQVTHALETGDFNFAEMLRDRLLEIDPMAFSHAVKLGELIDDQKKGVSGVHHLEIWGDLYEQMSTDEFNALYAHLREERYQKGEIIVNSGETDNKLYFLNSGYVSLSCMVGGQENFLKRMQPGEIFGGEQFFSASVWTVNLKALTVVQIQVLDLVAMEEICTDFPNIERVLRTYCQKFIEISSLLEMSGDDRREYPRFSGSLPIRTTLLDPYGGRSKRGFKGDLVDISRGGLAFSIRIAMKNGARLLLGRQVNTDLTLDGEIITCTGIIVGVRQKGGDDQRYSVHVKLAKHFEEKVFKKVISLLESI
ncbi:MAG: cyclic nucleotide-binding domain-containing protein [Desulforhopalus sp.]